MSVHPFPGQIGRRFMTNYATIADLEALWRPLRSGETEKAEALLRSVSALLRTEAKKRGRDFPSMLEEDEDLAEVAKSVTCDICARALMTSTDQEPVSQSTETTPGYSYSATYLVPGGGLFIKNSELARLGLKRQRYGVLDVYNLPESE